MRRRILPLLLTALLLLALAGCGGAAPAIFIAGECEGAAVTSKMPLAEAIALAQPHAEAFDLLIMGSDGLAARIPGKDMSGGTLVHSKEYAWELRGNTLPPSARVKNIASIAVVSVSEDPHAVRFIKDDTAQSLTAGQMLLESQRVLEWEGESQNNGGSVTVYTTRWRIPLEQVFPGESAFCAVSFDGKPIYFRGAEGCFLEYAKTRIDLMLSDGQKIENLAGVMADPPGFMITETAADALHFLEQGERVMVIELDGWGWAMQERAGSEYAPFLTALALQRALACYPPISPVGLAAMLTGEPPDINGIRDRENRMPACDDLFVKAAALGKSCAYVEGNHALLATSVAPVLSLNDAEVYTNAMQALEARPDLLFVHFHGIDDTAQDYGPYADETLRKIEEVDDYVRFLAEGFDGRIIVTADHGVHPTEEGGDHGLFLPEDMVVPYAIR